jgi:hypothetical protein
MGWAAEPHQNGAAGASGANDEDLDRAALQQLLRKRALYPHGFYLSLRTNCANVWESGISMSTGKRVRFPAMLLHSASKPFLWRVVLPTLAWVNSLS